MGILYNSGIAKFVTIGHETKCSRMPLSNPEKTGIAPKKQDSAPNKPQKSKKKKPQMPVCKASVSDMTPGLPHNRTTAPNNIELLYFKRFSAPASRQPVPAIADAVPKQRESPAAAPRSGVKAPSASFLRLRRSTRPKESRTQGTFPLVRKEPQKVHSGARHRPLPPVFPGITANPEHPSAQRSPKRAPSPIFEGCATGPADRYNSRPISSSDSAKAPEFFRRAR